MEPKSSKTLSRFYLPQLDGMRFFAFLCVFLFHALPVPNVSSHAGPGRTVAELEAVVHLGLASGVSLFFLLSAYLIAELLRREKEMTGTVHLKMFYIRRTLRIWPLYYLALAIGGVLPLVSASYALSTRDVLSYVFFFNNWNLAANGFKANPIFVLWSVSAEEQFYLVWPLAQKLLRAKRLAFFAAVLVIVFPVLAYLPWPGAAMSAVYVYSFFVLGGLLALLLNGRRAIVSGPTCVSLLAGGLLLWFAGSWFQGAENHVPALLGLVEGKLAVALGTLGLFLAFFMSPASWYSRPIVYLGKISYGLYVFHMMALDFMEWALSQAIHGNLQNNLRVTAKVPIAFCLTVAMAALSYELVERYFLGLKERFTVGYRARRSAQDAEQGARDIAA